MDEGAYKDFEARIRAIHDRAPWEVFRDFCELAAVSLQNALLQDSALEKRYLATAGHYSRQDLNRIAELIGVTARGLDPIEEDFLGQTFMRLELGSAWGGQFFTPLSVSQLLAQASLDGLDEKLAEQGMVTVHDPACGSGAMALAAARIFLERGHNPQTAMKFVGMDKDRTAAYMAFIQLTLAGIPAEIAVGNSLTAETWEVWHTPAVPMAMNAAHGLDKMLNTESDDREG